MEELVLSVVAHRFARQAVCRLDSGAGAISGRCIPIYVLGPLILPYPLNFRTEVRADALFVGCLLALALVSPAYSQNCESIYGGSASACCLPVASYRYNNLVPLFECVVVAMLITSGLADKSPLAPGPQPETPASPWHTLLQAYYVWQQPFSLLIHHDLGRIRLCYSVSSSNRRGELLPY